MDEKVNRGREVLATTLASGRNNVSTVFSNLSKNVEKFREQRRSQDVQPQNFEAVTSPVAEKASIIAPVATTVTPVLAEASTRAGAYFSSWAAWAGEKKKAFRQPPTKSPPPEPSTNVDEKFLPPDPPKKSFEESIFDARTRAAYGSDSSSVFSPPRTGSMTTSNNPTIVGKDLNNGKGVGLGIVNLEPQSPPPAPTAENVVRSPNVKKVEPALPPLPIEENKEKETEREISPRTLVKDGTVQQPLPIIGEKENPLGSLEVKTSQSSVQPMGKAVEPLELEPVKVELSLPAWKTAPPPRTGVESTRLPVSVVEKAVKSSEPARAELSQPVVRKTSLPSSIGAEPTQLSMPAIEKTERPERPVQIRSSGPSVGEVEIPSIAERTNRRSTPTSDKTAKPLKSERLAPEPVKIPDYARAASVEVKSAREKALEPTRVARHTRAESTVIPGGEPSIKPLRHTRTESAITSSKTSGESLKAARHTRPESATISPGGPILKPIGHTRTESGRISPDKPSLKPERIKGSIAERAKRFSQSQDEPSDSGNVSPARAAFAARRAMFEKK